MQILELNQVTKEILGNKLFEIKRLIAHQGQVIGIVGANGAGKSTLLKLIAGIESTEQGQVSLEVTPYYLPQINVAPNKSGGQISYDYLLQAFESGAKLLLLDEPTANLDRDHQAWLVKKVKNCPACQLIVSHDRNFLNQVVDRIWAFDQGVVKEYVGNYQEYEEALVKEKAKAQADYQAYLTKTNQLHAVAQERLDYASRYKKRKKNVSISDYKVNSRMGKYDATEKAIARSAKAIEKRISQLEIVEKPKQEQMYQFNAVGALLGRQQTLLNLVQNRVQIDGRLLFEFDEFKLCQGDKRAIVGPNQAGKTTFLKGILDHSYRGYYAEDLRMGYFAQDFNELKADQSVLECVSEESLQDRALIMNFLSRLGFKEDRLGQKVASLSGGERVRLQLAKVLLADRQLLLLDEPTNYLDINTLQAVEEFLREYPGSFILVSHDATFVDNTCQDQWLIDHQKLIAPVYQKKYANQKQKKIQLLNFRLQELLQAEEMDLEAIRKTKQAIDSLTD